MEELSIMGCFISEKRHPYLLLETWHVNLRKQMFQVRAIMRMTENTRQSRVMFPGHPSPGDNIILTKLAFAPNFRLGVLSKAMVLFNSFNNWLQLHLCWPLVQVMLNVSYPYDLFIFFHSLLISLLHISTSQSLFIFFPCPCY